VIVGMSEADFVVPAAEAKRSFYSIEAVEGWRDCATRR
jgi:hypothetical protein